MTGIVIGISTVAFLQQRPFGTIDELLGNLSYGVFLNHFLMIWLADHFSISRLFVPIAALIAAAVSYKLIEEPALRWRRHLRNANAARGLN
jgi:peptidoglycan/LPS O-acetylase OafA/YrhL